MVKKIEKSIRINAPAAKIWRVFTDPLMTRQMGGEYISEWKVGSAFGWKGADGKMYTNGTILKIEPEKILQHNLFNKEGSLTSVISYELLEEDWSAGNAGRFTILHAREEFTKEVSDQDYTDAVEGWDGALAQIKELAEK